ncbi:putative PGG domain-containing protein [Helianthus anomalus]
MKQTSGSYTITTTLIIIMVFSTIINVPWRNNRETERAIYKDKLSFMIYCYSLLISFFHINLLVVSFHPHRKLCRGGFSQKIT